MYSTHFHHLDTLKVIFWVKTVRFLTGDVLIFLTGDTFFPTITNHKYKINWKQIILFYYDFSFYVRIVNYRKQN